MQLLDRPRDLHPFAREEMDGADAWLGIDLNPA
jgi:hypothetical protein